MNEINAFNESDWKDDKVYQLIKDHVFHGNKIVACEIKEKKRVGPKEYRKAIHVSIWNHQTNKTSNHVWNYKRIERFINNGQGNRSALG